MSGQLLHSVNYASYIIMITSVVWTDECSISELHVCATAINWNLYYERSYIGLPDHNIYFLQMHYVDVDGYLPNGNLPPNYTEEISLSRWMYVVSCQYRVMHLLITLQDIFIKLFFAISVLSNSLKIWNKVIFIFTFTFSFTFPWLVI